MLSGRVYYIFCACLITFESAFVVNNTNRWSLVAVAHTHMPHRTARPPAAPKERKKTCNPREGWEDGTTPPPHRECGASLRPPPLGTEFLKTNKKLRYTTLSLPLGVCVPLPISLRSLQPILAATFMPYKYMRQGTTRKGPLGLYY